MKIAHTQQTDRGLPSVNFLSPQVFEAIATRRLRRRFATAGCALILFFGAWSVVQAVRVNQAEQILAIAQAEGVQLGAQTRALAPVRAYVSAVDKQKHTVQTAMANEVYVSRVLDGLRASAPDGVNVQTASVAVASPDIAAGAGAPTGAVAAATGACPGPDPFLIRPAAGCLTMTGSATNRRAVGDFVISLGGSPLFLDPFISATTATVAATSAATTAATVAAPRDSVTFTGSVSLSPKAFSRRYADLDALLASGGN